MQRATFSTHGSLSPVRIMPPLTSVGTSVRPPHVPPAPHVLFRAPAPHAHARVLPAAAVSAPRRPSSRQNNPAHDATGMSRLMNISSVQGTLTAHSAPLTRIAHTRPPHPQPRLSTPTLTPVAAAAHRLRASNLPYQAGHLPGVCCITPGMVCLKNIRNTACTYSPHAATSLFSDARSRARVLDRPSAYSWYGADGA